MARYDFWRAHAERQRVFKERHIESWPPECREVLKLLMVGYGAPDAARLLDIDERIAFGWTLFALGSLFGYPEDESEVEHYPTYYAVQHWLFCHKECCTRAMYEEVLTQTYPLAELHGLMQPSALHELVANAHLSRDPFKTSGSPRTPGPSARWRADQDRDLP